MLLLLLLLLLLSVRSAVRRKEYAAAATAYEAALTLNPLYPDVWFSLGYCYLRLDQTQKALQVRGGCCCCVVGWRLRVCVLSAVQVCRTETVTR